MKGVVFNNLHELAAECAGREIALDDPDPMRWVKRAVFKHTESGPSVWSPDPSTVILSGYCEGTDRYGESIELHFPIRRDDWYAAVQQADDDGVTIWNETHGCDKCAEYFGLDPEVEGEWPVWKDCPQCKGDGEVR